MATLDEINAAIANRRAQIRALEQESRLLAAEALTLHHPHKPGEVWIEPAKPGAPARTWKILRTHTSHVFGYVQFLCEVEEQMPNGAPGTRPLEFFQSQYFSAWEKVEGMEVAG